MSDKKWTLFWASRLSMATSDKRPIMFIWPSKLPPLVFYSGARCNCNWGWLRCVWCWMAFGRSYGYYHSGTPVCAAVGACLVALISLSHFIWVPLISLVTHHAAWPISLFQDHMMKISLKHWVMKIYAGNLIGEIPGEGYMKTRKQIVRAQSLDFFPGFQKVWFWNISMGSAGDLIFLCQKMAKNFLWSL